MHGRLKVRTTEEQKLLKWKEQQKKLAAYRLGMKQILQSRMSLGDGYDPESFSICAQLLTINPDIYTLWNYRKEVALLEITIYEDRSREERLKEFLDNELKLTEQCLLANPKSYGSWYHRYWILEQHPRPVWSNELELCTKYLSLDDRNFHCWDYRRLILSKIEAPLFEELKFSTDCINVNFSNYSSWHYRSTLGHLNADNIAEEFELIQNALFTDPADSSAWFYLRWILNNQHVTRQHVLELHQALNQLLELEPECRWILIAKCWLNEEAFNPDVIGNKKTACKKLESLDQMRKGKYLDDGKED